MLEGVCRISNGVSVFARCPLHGMPLYKEVSRCVVYRELNVFPLEKNIISMLSNLG